MFTPEWVWFGDNTVVVTENDYSMSYTRTEHFRNTLKEYTGKYDVNDVPKDLLSEIRGLCASPGSLTYNYIKKIMKEKGLLKYYVHIYSIIKHLGGCVLTINDQQYNKLELRFREFSAKYNEVVTPTTPTTPTQRAFIPYPYLLCKLCESIGITVPITVRTSMEPSLRKLIHYESVCKKVYDALNWKFIGWIL